MLVILVSILVSIIVFLAFWSLPMVGGALCDKIEERVFERRKREEWRYWNC